MSIIDPLYTLPLLLFSVLAILFAHRGYHLVALLGWSAMWALARCSGKERKMRA